MKYSNEILTTNNTTTNTETLCFLLFVDVDDPWCTNVSKPYRVRQKIQRAEPTGSIKPHLLYFLPRYGHCCHHPIEGAASLPHLFGRVQPAGLNSLRAQFLQGLHSEILAECQSATVPHV